MNDGAFLQSRINELEREIADAYKLIKSKSDTIILLEKQLTDAERKGYELKVKYGREKIQYSAYSVFRELSYDDAVKQRDGKKIKGKK